jgi:flagellar biosynthesis protein FlhG
MNPPLTLTDFLNHRLNLYRFIKLAGGTMDDALADRDFSSVEEVLDVEGQTDKVKRGIAETALRAFHPTLILNRLSERAHVIVAGLKRIL